MCIRDRLWAYTENDRFFGPTLPREWFQAFQAAGGRGEFKQFPPHGEDVEDSGNCNNRMYPPAYRAAADQSVQLLAELLKRDDVLKDRTVVLGQSFGGATAVTLASLNPPGVVALSLIHI